MAASDVTDIIQSAMEMGNTLSTDASEALQGALQRLDTPSFESYEAAATYQSVRPTEFNGSPISLRVSPVNTGGAPTSAPSLAVIPGPDYGNAPAFTYNAPVFANISTPAQLEALTAVIPFINPITVPDAPSALLSINLVPPTIHDITIPTAPTVVLPEFLVTQPNTDIATPTDFAVEYAQNYADSSTAMRATINAELDAQLLKLNPRYTEQMAKLEDKLSLFLEGGTALPPEVEQAIFNRTRDKINEEYLRTRDGIMVEGSKRGFTIPGGAQFSALSQARQAAADNNSRASIEIAIKQAELEQNNTQFAVTQTQNLRTAVMQTMTAWFTGLIQLNGQGLEYSKDLLAASIAVYETLVKIVASRVEVYKAEATIYATKLDAAMAIYEVYKAEVSALQAQAQVDTAKVEAFSAQASAYNALAGAYKAIIDGTVAKAEVEKLKVDIYETEVRAYATKVGAKQAEWQGFAAQLQGETAKSEVYKSQVGAYSAQVTAYNTKINAYNARVDGISKQNVGTVDVFKATVDAYAARVSAEGTRAQAEGVAAASEAQKFEAEANAHGDANRAKIADAEASARVGVANMEAKIQAAIATSKANNDFMTSAAQISVQAAQVYGTMSASALSGITGIAQIAEITNK